MTFRRFGIGTAMAMTAVATALTWTPVAVADPGEFLEELNINQVWLPFKTPGEVIGAGYATCEHLRSGTSVLDEMAAVERVYGFNQGTLFVSAASTNLCPDFAAG